MTGFLKEIHYQADIHREYLIDESSSKFILRTYKGSDPEQILYNIPVIHPLLSYIKRVALFPDSQVAVYECTGGTAMRDELKQLIRKYAKSSIKYVGTVLEYKHSNSYQIYTGNIYLEFAHDVSDEHVESFFQKNGLNQKKTLSFKNNAFFCEPSQLLGRNIFDFCLDLLQDGRVHCCHPELVTELRSEREHYRTAGTSSLLDPLWWIRQAHVDRAWEIGKGDGMKIAIIDDGIEMNHPAFEDKIIGARDMLRADAHPIHQGIDSHGTPCASIATSLAPQAMGVAPLAQLIPIRITGLGSIMQSEAFYWAVQQGADVISCSWGPPDGNISKTDDDENWYPLPDHTKRAFEYAHSQGRNGRGCPIIFAAGNGHEPVQFDGYASTEEVIAVTSINHKFQKTIYGDYGFPVWCAFPSGDELLNDQGQVINTGIMVADRLGAKGYSLDHYYTLFTGTSASCPGVAGVVALILEQAPDLDVGQVKSLLARSCDKRGGVTYNSQGYSREFGHGLLNAHTAVKNAQRQNESFNKKPNNMKTSQSLHIGINDYSAYPIRINNLSGCIHDMKAMQKLAEGIGFETHTLADEQATKSNIQQSIIDLGNAMSDGGMLLVSFAGHGARIEEENNPSLPKDESNDYDESWLCYDDFLLDDEIYNTLCEIKRNIRVVVLSDSCHSETTTRTTTPNENFRFISPYEVREILQKQGRTVNQLLQSSSRSATVPSVKVINLSVAESRELAKEMNGQGLFTRETIQTYHEMKSKASFNYDLFIQEVRKRVNAINYFQNPNISFSHKKSTSYRNEPPFFIKNQDISAKQNTSETAVDNASTEAKSKRLRERAYFLNYLWLTDHQDKTKVIHAGESRSPFENIWDAAYQYVLNTDQSHLSAVSPSVIANVYLDGERKMEGQSRSIDNGQYLPTYPYPRNWEDPKSFIWHLSDKYSQLRTAAESVFPELNQDQRRYEKSVVRIAHIDTGVLPNHPTRPINQLAGKAFYLNHDEEKSLDKDIQWYPAEQQGHGQGTIAILAGNWITKEESRSNFEGFYGAIPYAEVLPIKISESVVLLSGRLFAKAVDYAIDQGCDVITMSMAGLPSSVMAKAIDRAYEAGVVVVAAAGNCWSKGIARLTPKKTLYPARYRRVIAAVGATYHKTPYRNAYNKEQRAAGGEYMQSCYGPSFVMETTLAAFTPNIVWFNKIESNAHGRAYYVKSGGGTSSAAPQIAAAAALYIQKFKEELEHYEGKNQWKRTEIVRQALFRSADKDSQYTGDYFGQGMLKAADAINDRFRPRAIQNVKDPGKAQNKFILNGLLNLFSNRNMTAVQSDTKMEMLQQMMREEISQLVFLDPMLELFQELEFEHPRFDLFSHPQLIEQLIQSDRSSEFLKEHLSYLNRNPQKAHQDFGSKKLPSQRGELIVRTSYCEVELQKRESEMKGAGHFVEYMDSFELQIEGSKNRSLRGTHRLEIQLHTHEMAKDDICHSALLIEREAADGTPIVEWQFGPESQGISRGLDEELAQNHFIISTQAPGQRNLLQGARKIIVRAFRWISKRIKRPNNARMTKKLLQNIGDRSYGIMIYDLKLEEIHTNSGWQNIALLNDKSYQNVLKLLQKNEKPTLLLLPGLFSKVERGFDEFLAYEDHRDQLLKSHNRYIIGLNMPTVVQGIEENAASLCAKLKIHFEGIRCTCIARSRGGMVARYMDQILLKSTSSKKTDAPPLIIERMLMTGTPNVGTPIASFENWKSLFNAISNLALLSMGSLGPIMPTITTALRAIGQGITELPGIQDLAENSAAIKTLNKKEFDKNSYYAIASDFEPTKWWKRLLDENIIDKHIFENEPNDGVVPKKSVLGITSELKPSEESLIRKDFLSFANHEVNHFSYLDREKHPALLREILAWLGDADFRQKSIT